MHGTRIEVYTARHRQLKAIRDLHIPVWRLIIENMAPYLAVWDTRNDRNRGERKDANIINSKPVQSVKALSAGLMAYITSPSRKFFGMAPVDKSLSKQKNVKLYLDEATSRIASAFQTSNFYPSLSNTVYPSLVTIGNGPMFEDDIDGQIHFEPMPLGQYCLGINSQKKTDTCYRELAYTSDQMIGEFGRDKCSLQVRTAYDQSDYQTPFVVIHAVMPNSDHRPGALSSQHKKFASCWYEQNTEKGDEFLREKGYDDFPVLAPQWSNPTGDIYGRGPGGDVLGDCLELQHHELSIVELIDKAKRPPLGVRGRVTDASLQPGAITRIARGQENSVEPLMTVDPRMVEMTDMRSAKIERRIDAGMFTDLLRRLIDDQRNQRATATEIEEMRQETMRMFGPVLDNLNPGLLEPAVVRTYNILQRNGQLPEPPQELQGGALKVEFQSIMHQMQRTNELGGIRALLQEMAFAANLRPDIVDKLDGDSLADTLAEITGVNPAMLLSKDEVGKVRQMVADQKAAQENGQAMLAATQGVKNLGNVDTQKLSDVAQMLSPAVAGQGGALAPVRGG